MAFWKKKPSVTEIKKSLAERRELPIGRQAFEEWSDRIIAGALLPADKRSQKFVLTDMLLHLGPTEDFKEDAHFIHTLRKYAVNQVAITIREELKKQQQDEIKAKEEENKKEASHEQAIGSPSIQAP